MLKKEKKEKRQMHSHFDTLNKSHVSKKYCFSFLLKTCKELESFTA